MKDPQVWYYIKSLSLFFNLLHYFINLKHISLLYFVIEIKNQHEIWNSLSNHLKEQLMYDSFYFLNI